MVDVVIEVQQRAQFRPMSTGELRVIAQSWASAAPSVTPLEMRLALLELTRWPAPDTVALQIRRQRAQQGIVWAGRAAGGHDLTRWPETLNSLKRVADPDYGEVTDMKRATFVELWLKPIPVAVQGGRLVLDPWTVSQSWGWVAVEVLSGGLGPVRAEVSLDDVARVAGCAMAVRLPAPQQEAAG